MPVFDQAVFDITFDILYGIPVLHKVEVERGVQKIASGQITVINAYIISRTNPQQPVLFNPDGGVTVSIFYPSGAVKVDNATMLNVGVGIYQYRHQTGIVMDDTVFDSNTFDITVNDPVGIYTAFFRAREGYTGMQSRLYEVFEVV